MDSPRTHPPHRPAVGSEPPATPEQVAAAEVGVALLRALNAHRFYAEGNVRVTEFQQKLWATLQHYHGVSGGAAVLHVRSTGLLVGDVPVAEFDSARDSLTRPLFLEGVREILLQPGLEQEPLGAFVLMWHRALQRSLPDEHDFYTSFWEYGFEDLELVVAEVPPPLEAGVDLAGHEEQLFSQFTPRHAPSLGAPSKSLGRDEWLAHLEAEVLAPVSMQDLARSAAPSFTGIPDVELAELRVGLERPEGGLLGRGLRVVWDLLAVCREDERMELLGWAEEVLSALISRGLWVELQQGVQEMIRDARATSARAPDLYALMRLFMKQQVRGALAVAAARPGELPRLLGLLDSLPRDALLEGPELLFALSSPEARAALAKLLARRGVPLGALVARVASLGEVDVEWLRALLDAPPLTAALLGHPLPAVRLAVLGRLGAREVEVHRVILLKLLGDATLPVRQAALGLLVQHQVEAAVGPLVSRLQAPLEAEERKAVLRALAELGGAAAAAALRQAFEREQDLELKAHCARCIGLLGDPRARPLLEAVAQKPFAPKVLRDACRRALTQLAPVG
ncbi:HEAT repeat domain-containing protein [Pyxidicoccus sp. MSG2]|uniref:HEAT repeat domain-containing protein n=1 Tax=Pyxidicoccus sp. MSG2 TaxID=2996790 RepID=UPI002271A0F4|nr:HEAT repeat domain-containing protein [Pyxidicoccus sp. MSG2]MCY1019035.1 HEAT repeat domain-containing protein [Pyxidicoccus sp. MSG2]